MKLFWLILRGFLVIWVLLAASIVAMLFLVTDAITAILWGGISSTLITGVVVYFIVHSRVKTVQKAHPEFRKRK